MAKRKKSLIGQLIENAVRRAATETTRKYNGGSNGGFWEDNTKKVKSFSETVREQNAKALRSGTRPTTTTRTLLDTSIKRQQQRNTANQIKQNNFSDVANSVTRRADQKARTASAFLNANPETGRKLQSARQKLQTQARIDAANKSNNNRLSTGMANAMSGGAYIPEISTKRQQRERRNLINEGIVKRDDETERFYEQHPVMAGFAERFEFETPEQIARREYGEDGYLDEDRLNKVRSTGKFAAGQMLGDLAWYAGAAPMYGIAGANGIAGGSRLVRGTRSAKAVRGAVARQVGKETLINSPVNAMLALKDSKDAKEFVDNFKKYEFYDVIFSLGINKVAGRRFYTRNKTFNKAMKLRTQGKNAEAMKEFKKLSYKDITKIADELTEFERSELVRSGNLSADVAGEIAGREKNLADLQYREQQRVRNAIVGDIQRQAERERARETALRSRRLIEGARGRSAVTGAPFSEEIDNLRALRQGATEDAANSGRVPESVNEAWESVARDGDELIAPSAEAPRQSSLRDELIAERGNGNAEEAERARQMQAEAEVVENVPSAEVRQVNSNRWETPDGHYAIENDGGWYYLEELTSDDAFPIDQYATYEEAKNTLDRIMADPERSAGRFAVEDSNAINGVDPERAVETGEELADAMSRNASKYGTHDEGLPRANDGRRTSQAADNLRAKSDASDAAVAEADARNFIANDGGYDNVGMSVKDANERAANAWRADPRSQQKKLDNAVRSIKRKNQVPDGYQSLQEFFADTRTGMSMYRGMEEEARRTGDDVLLNQAINAQADILEASSTVASNMGSGMRQYQELLNATPEVRVRTIKRQVDAIKERYAKLLKKRNITDADLEIPDELLDAVRLAEGTDAQIQAMKDISEWVWDRVPATMKEKADAWRVTAMLLNPKTHVRNLFGNLLFRPAVAFKDLLATPIEEIARRSGNLEARDARKAIINPFSQEGKEYRAAARKIWNEYKDAIRGESRFYEGFDGMSLKQRPIGGSVFSAGRQNSGSKVGNAFRKAGDKVVGFNNKMLDQEDILFMRSKFIDSYAKTLKARDIDPDTFDILDTSVDDIIKYNPQRNGHGSQEIIDSVAEARKGLSAYTEILNRTDRETLKEAGDTLQLGRYDQAKRLNNAFDRFEKVFDNSIDARKVTDKELKDATENLKKQISSTQMEIIDDAAEEALRSTFRDANRIASAINRWRRTVPEDTGWQKTRAWAIDTTMPFVKTPINILRRSVEYSPYQILDSGAHLLKAINAGDSAAVAKAIDGLASGTTGTGIMLIGFWLGMNGRLNASLAEDEDGYYKQDLGMQNFALNIGGDDGKSVNLDWAAPGAIPLFIGVNIANLKQDESIGLTNFIDVAGGMLDPAFEMSVLQGVTNLFRSVSQGQSVGQATEEAVLSTGLNYAGQFNPTILGQINRTLVDPIRRDTTPTGDGTATRAIKKWGMKQAAKIPVLSKQLSPYLDAWGREQSNFSSERLSTRLLEGFVSPAYIKSKKVTDVDKEILRLNDKAADDEEYVNPVKFMGSSLELDGKPVEIDKELQNNYNKVRGQKSYDYVSDLMKTDEYKNASDKDKRKLINKQYDLAKLDAKHDTLIKAGKEPWTVWTDDLPDSKKEAAEDAKAAGFEPEQYYKEATNKAWDANGNGRATKLELTTYLDGRNDLSGEQKAVLFGINSTAKNPYGAGVTKSGYTGNSSKKGRSSGRRRSGGGSSKSKARAKTDSEKAFTAATSAKLRSDIKSIDFNKINNVASGMSKSQRKALLKLIQKELKA